MWSQKERAKPLLRRRAWARVPLREKAEIFVSPIVKDGPEELALHSKEEYARLGFVAPIGRGVICDRAIR